MANAALILETALLLLAAFIVGCVVGSLARRLSLRRLESAARLQEESAAGAAAPAPPVAVPVVAPLFQPTPPPPAAGPARPAVATKSVSASPLGIGQPALPVEAVAAPVPPPAPMPVAMAVREERRPARVAGQLFGWAPVVGTAPAAPAAMPLPAAAGSDAEMAARRAVEGSWMPPPRHAPAPFPEAAADPDDGISAALAGVRSAVAAARSAADAALAEVPAEVSASRHGRRGFGAPELLDAPREGRKDDLTALRGISRSVEASLNALGIFHFHQVAGWDQKAVVWVDNHLGLKGRIAREKWPEQARRLVASVRSLRSRR
jgi:predicted flap endonuclease-1-like 5' DNA nuclease